MGDNFNFEKEFVHLARIALSDKSQDAYTFLHRLAKRPTTEPGFAKSISALLKKRPTRSSPLRRNPEAALPVDTDSRLQLLRIDENCELLHEPVYADEVQRVLSQLVKERRNLHALAAAHLEPTKTVLFTGLPGVGKTLGARWLARELDRPLLILDLSAVMSSYLGRTGSNLRHVLDYAKSKECVLLLDELDAIAKRRDDSTEIGELKRLVTVLLQQLDEWPSSGLLIAATNHAELLDPAVWRRFEELVEFDLPGQESACIFIHDHLKEITPKSEEWSKILSIVLGKNSYSDIERKIIGARRAAALNGDKIDEQLSRLICVENGTKQERIDLAVELARSNLASQRRASELTGVARDTIRDRLKEDSNTG